MEIVGGFMVMMSIIGLFLAVVWLIMPFVVFAIKGKQDRALEILESIEKRLAVLEALTRHESSQELPIENKVTLTESAAGKEGPEASPAV